MIINEASRRGYHWNNKRRIVFAWVSAGVPNLEWSGRDKCEADRAGVRVISVAFVLALDLGENECGGGRGEIAPVEVFADGLLMG